MRTFEMTSFARFTIIMLEQFHHTAVNDRLTRRHSSCSYVRLRNPMYVENPED